MSNINCQWKIPRYHKTTTIFQNKWKRKEEWIGDWNSVQKVGNRERGKWETFERSSEESGYTLPFIVKASLAESVRSHLGNANSRSQLQRVLIIRLYFEEDASYLLVSPDSLSTGRKPRRERKQRGANTIAHFSTKTFWRDFLRKPIHNLNKRSASRNLKRFSERFNPRIFSPPSTIKSFVKSVKELSRKWGIASFYN